MAKKEEQVEVVEPEVVEETKAVAVKGPKEKDISIKLAAQVRIVQGVELRGNLEKLKLGAMVSEAVRILKLEDEAQTGRGHAGGGALGWWNDVCPADESGAPVIAYRTVMRWKQAAENLPLIMGEDGFEVGKIIALMAKNPNKVVGKDAKILASAEKAVNGMTMRQMLLWGGDEAAPKSKGGRPKAEKAKCRWCDERGMCTNRKSQCKGLPCPAKRCGMFERESYAKTAEDRIAEAEEQTRELMGKIGAYFRGKWFETVSEQTKNDFIRSLKDWAEVASERM